VIGSDAKHGKEYIVLEGIHALLIKCGMEMRFHLEVSTACWKGADAGS
jgi:hypothetical protein